MCLCIHPSIDDTWVPSTFELLGICHYEGSVQISLLRLTFNSFGYIPGSRIAGSWGLYIFNIFWGNTILFSTEVVPFYISTNSAQRFQFLHIIIDAFFSDFWFRWKDCLMPWLIGLINLGTLVKNQLITYASVYFWDLYSVPRISMLSYVSITLPWLL